VDSLEIVVILPGAAEHGSEDGEYFFGLEPSVPVLAHKVLILDGILAMVVEEKVEIFYVGAVGLVLLVVVLLDPTDRSAAGRLVFLHTLESPLGLL
jgi:hypothetical protein